MPKGHLKRTLFSWTSGLVLLLLLAVILYGPCLLPTDWIRRLIQDVLTQTTQQTLKEKVRVYLAGVEWRYWNHIRILGLSIRGEKGREPILTIGSLDLRLRLMDLARRRLVVQSLHINRPTVSLDAKMWQGFNLAALQLGKKEGLLLAIEKLRLTEAAVTLRQHSRELVRLADIRLWAEGAEDVPIRYRLNLRVRTPEISGHVRTAGQLVAFAGSPPGLIFEELTFETAQLIIRAMGKLLLGGNSPWLDLRVVTRLNLREANKLLADLIPNGLLKGSGPIALASHITGNLNNLTINGAFDLPVGTLQIQKIAIPIGAATRDIEFALRLSAEKVEISNLTLLSQAGRVNIKGHVSGLRTKPHAQLKLVAQDVDSRHLFKQVCAALKANLSDWKVAGKVQAEATLTIHSGRCAIEGVANLDKLAVVGLSQLELKAPDATWHANFNLVADGRSLHINEGTRFKGDIFLIALSGVVGLANHEPTLEITAVAEMDVGQAIKRWGRTFFDFAQRVEATGRVYTVARISGKPSNLEIAWTDDWGNVAFALDGKPLRDAGRPAGSTIKARLHGDTLTLEQVDMHSEFGKLSITGTVLALGGSPVFGLTLTTDVALESVVAMLQKHGIPITDEWKFTGSPQAVNVTITGPSDRLKIKGQLDLAGVRVLWRDTELFVQKESPEFRWAFSCVKGRLQLEEILYRSRGGELVLNSVSHNLQELRGHAILRIEEFRPVISSAVEFLVAGAEQSNLPPSMKALIRRLGQDLRITGTMAFPSLVISYIPDGVRFSGVGDLSAFALNYRNLPLKVAGERLEAEIRAEATPTEIRLAKASLRSGTGFTEISGHICAPPASPVFRLGIGWRAGFQKMLARVPVVKILADEPLNQALKDIGVDVADLEDKFDITGELCAHLELEGGPDEIQWRLNADLTHLDILYGKVFTKPAEGIFRASFAGRATPKTFTISSAAIEGAGGKVSMTGHIMVTLPLITAQDVKLDVAGKQYAAAFRLSDVRPGGFCVDFARLEHAECRFALEGPLRWEPYLIQADDLQVRINNDTLKAQVLARNYYGDHPVIRFRLRGAGLDLSALFPASIPEKIANKSIPAHPQAATKAPLAALTPSLINFLRRATVDVSIMLGKVKFEFYDHTDRNPAVRRYEMCDISMETTSQNGSLKAEATLGFNGGMLDVIANVDFNRQSPEVQVEAWAAGVRGADNLRPFLNSVFPNIYVDGSLSVRSRLKWSGFTQHEFTQTQLAQSWMEIQKGHMVGKAAPDYVLKVFPQLNLVDYRFDECKIVSTSRGPVARTKMTFLAPTLCLYMEGQSRNDTGEVDYLLYVDMVASMGLDGARDHIPKLLQESAKVSIVRYRGHLNDQHAEWFTPKVETVREIVTRLMPLKSIGVLTSPDKTAQEKAEYFEKQIRHLLLLPINTVKRLLGIKDKKKESWQPIQPPSKERPMPPEIPNEFEQHIVTPRESSDQYEMVAPK